ncbi:MAG: flagellar hook-basal body complex protein FliE [Oscillospiraceae bacterium]
MAISAIQPLQAAGEAAKVTRANAAQGSESFADYLTEAVQKVRDLETASNESSYALATGQTDDLTGVMLDATKAQTAVELTTQITTRAVNAYKEIMQMQI